jgi:hypothetical protein
MEAEYKSSSQVLDEIFEEVQEDFDLEGLTKEQIRHFHNNMFKSYRELLSNDEFNRVYIHKLGTFQPMASRIEDIILKEKDSLPYYPKDSKVRKAKEEKIAKLQKEQERVVDVSLNYNKTK